VLGEGYGAALGRNDVPGKFPFTVAGLRLYVSSKPWQLAWSKALKLRRPFAAARAARGRRVVRKCILGVGIGLEM
jgi:hypothetical protein